MTKYTEGPAPLSAETIAKKGRKAVEKKARALTRLAVEYVGVETIKPNRYNPNRQSDHDFELLLRSMREDGFTQPIVVQEKTREIVDGEHRWRAAKELGLTEIPVVFVDMTPEQMRISTLRHNRARGSEDIELSAQVLRDLRELGALDWAQDSLMLDDVELQRLMDDVTAPEALAGEEFKESWEPDGAHQAAPSADVAEVIASDGSVSAVASSVAAVDALRERERKIAAAKTAEEREMVRREAAVYRLHMIFAGEEAEAVKAALGDRPAESLVTMCREKMARGDRT